MKITLKNLAPGRVLELTGPRVDVLLQDDGQAIVTMTLTIGDGTHFHYPDGGAIGSAQSTTLAPGDHDAVLRISALKMERFGRTYDSRVSVGGIEIATAAGTIADGKQDETALKFFVVRVTGAQ